MVAETVNTSMMKKVIVYSLLVGLFLGCKKDNYPGSVISPYVAIFDIRQLYKGADLKLTKECTPTNHTK